MIFIIFGGIEKISMLMRDMFMRFMFILMMVIIVMNC